MNAQIQGVETKQLVRHYDERGYFQEIIRASDDFFVGFGQWSISVMYQGVIKAFHCHSIQYDYWLVPVGTIKAVLVDTRGSFEKDGARPTREYILGDNQPPCVLVIPPGVAHGLKVLQGPAILMYITSEEYNPDDEGRIPYDALGYDWDKRVIK